MQLLSRFLIGQMLNQTQRALIGQICEIGRFRSTEERVVLAATKTQRTGDDGAPVVRLEVAQRRRGVVDEAGAEAEPQR